MSLGTKINLMIAGVTVVILTIAFTVIVSVEAGSIKKQTLRDSTVMIGMIKDDLDRMFQEVYRQQRSLQSIVDKLSVVGGIRHIGIIDARGYYISSSNHNEVGKKAEGADSGVVAQVFKEGKEIDTQEDGGTFFVLHRYVPIRINEKKDSLGIVAVVELSAETLSKKAEELRDTQKILQSISVSVEQSVSAAIAIRIDDLEVMQKITEEIKGFEYYHDFIVFDNKLNAIASTNNNNVDFTNDPQEFKQYREDVLFGKTLNASYERPHDEGVVQVNVSPIEIVEGGKVGIVGVFEAHVRLSSYKDKVTSLVLWMTGAGLLFTMILIAALAFILHRIIIKPFKEYSEVAKKVSEGDLSQQISHITNDEIGRFGEVFNAMVANLYELDRLKTDFITVAAHQLRTPLSSVNWALKLLLDSEVGAINQDQRSMLERGFETNSKMIKLVNDLLDVTRIEHGKFVYKFEANDFNQLLDTLIKSSELIAQEHNIEVRLEKHEEIPLFAFDVDKLSMAVQNLLDNALKYTLPGGRILIATQQKGNYLEVRVSDTGVGIPKDELPKIFSKFFRATNAVHLQTEGSGLGLVIAKNIIARHGGQIWVDSIEGKGTTLTFTVPLLPELLPKDETLVPEGRAVMNTGVLG